MYYRYTRVDKETGKEEVIRIRQVKLMIERAYISVHDALKALHENGTLNTAFFVLYAEKREVN